MSLRNSEIQLAKHLLRQHDVACDILSLDSIYRALRSSHRCPADIPQELINAFKQEYATNSEHYTNYLYKIAIEVLEKGKNNT